MLPFSKKFSIFATKSDMKMINPINIRQARAFARQDGLILATAWIISFICAMQAYRSSFLGLISSVLQIATPFIVGYTLKKFRDKILDGNISFRRAFFYSMETFFYASIILTIFQFAYLKWGDTTGFMAQISEYSKIAAQMYRDTYHMSPAQVKQVMEAFTMMTPLAWASAFLMTELIGGLIISPIIALIMKRQPEK